MKKRIFAGAIVLFIGSLLAAACDDGEADYYQVEPSGNYCRHFTTCGACTPVEGCGWCQTGVGKGMCATDPDECDGNSAFSWTWDPSGCVGGSATPVDAGAQTTDAGQAAEDAGEGVSNDAAPSSSLEDAGTQTVH